MLEKANIRRVNRRRTYLFAVLAVFAATVLMPFWEPAVEDFPGHIMYPGEACAQSPAASAQWPHENSDLQPDPAVVYGNLPNGFRYALMKNGNPRDRVSLHLDVMAGSMHETENQRGLAHFLEHMLFNGSTNFPPGELVKYFQGIGMQFGPDANAHTGFAETVYDILLPDSSRESLEKGLLVIRDYAMGALLLPEEIDRERGVILAEKRSRDSADYRTFVETLAFEFPDARLSKRLPIGIERVIRQADQETMRDYYDTWYRPETMVLVMVGDFDTDLAVSLIRDQFASMAARAPARPEPDFGSIAHGGNRIFHHFEAESGKTTVTIEVIEKVKPESDSLAVQRRLLIENIADRIVQDRLDVLMRDTDAPYTEASIGSGLFLQQAKISSISAECKPENWEKTLTAMEQTLRRALMFGFTDGELERVKKDLQSDLSNAVNQSATRESPDLARAIIRHLNVDRVFMAPDQEKKIFEPMIETLTPQRVHDGFKQRWSADHRLILVTGNADLADAPEKTISEVYGASLNIPVVQETAVKPVTFPYLPEPVQGGKILQRRSFADIGVVQIDFANGVRLNLKPTDFKADEVVANVSFGFGKSSQPPGKAGLADLAVDVINESALGALDRSELDRALAGKTTEVVFGIGEDRFFLKGATINAEMPLLFQLFHAFLKDPGFREKSYQLSVARYTQKHLELSQSTDGAMALAGYRFLAGGDERFGLPRPEAFGQLSLADVRSWIEPLLKNAVLEVSVVGDFQLDTVIDLAGRYFGSLTRKLKPQAPEISRRPVFPVSEATTFRIKTKIPKGLVVVAYPTADFYPISLTRRLNILGQVFSDRLRETIREKLGAAYSPVAYNRPSRAYRDYGVFQAIVQTAPETAETVRDEIQTIAGDLARGGVTAEALKRAIEPTLTSIKDMMRTNGYWLNTVLTGSRRHPEQIPWSRSIAADYAAITAAELSQLAAAYLVNAKAAVIMALPEQ